MFRAGWATELVLTFSLINSNLNELPFNLMAIKCPFSPKAQITDSITAGCTYYIMPSMSQGITEILHEPSPNENDLPRL